MILVRRYGLGVCEVGKLLGCHHANVLHGVKKAEAGISMGYEDFMLSMEAWMVVFQGIEKPPISEFISRKINSLIRDCSVRSGTTEETVAVKIYRLLDKKIKTDD